VALRLERGVSWYATSRVYLQYHEQAMFTVLWRLKNKVKFYGAAVLKFVTPFAKPVSELLTVVSALNSGGGGDRLSTT
jgi:hypothetical protein